MKSKKIPKIFLATKHISLLSSRHETDNNIETDFVDTNYNRNHNMDSEVKPSAIGYSNRFTEQRLKTTLVASAEKMKHAFCRNVKVVCKLKLSKFFFYAFKD